MEHLDRLSQELHVAKASISLFSNWVHDLLDDPVDVREEHFSFENGDLHLFYCGQFLLPDVLAKRYENVFDKDVHAFLHLPHRAHFIQKHVIFALRQFYIKR